MISISKGKKVSFCTTLACAITLFKCVHCFAFHTNSYLVNAPHFNTPKSSFFLFPSSFEVLEKTPKFSPLNRVQKLPTIRIFNNETLIEEFLPESDGQSFREKMEKILDKELQNYQQLLVENLSKDIIKIKSEEEAQSYLDRIPSSSLLVCKYGAEWCRKCTYLKKVYEKLALNYADKPVSFMYFDYDAVFESGQVVEDNEEISNENTAIEDCLMCEGSGFVSCPECQSSGYIIRVSGEHQVADICPTCVGYKKIRCPTCGGKCLMCE